MNPLPDPQKSAAEAQAKTLIAAVNEALAPAAPVVPSSFHDRTPVPAYGPTPPVPQPGRPPMSQGATDASVLMLAGAGSVSMVSVSAGILMYLSQYADPVVCGIVLGAPSVVVLTLCRLMRRARETVQAAPPVHHHHYSGPVDQRSIHTDTRGLIARTRNELGD